VLGILRFQAVMVMTAVQSGSG